MAQLISVVGAAVGETTVIHTALKNPLGLRAFDSASNEYIYLQGIGSVVVGDVVAYDELYLCTRLLAATIGAIAVAQAAVVANTYGWFMIFGTCLGNVLTGFADNPLSLYSTSTAGSIDDSGAGAEEAISGMWGRSAVASGQATLQLNYPSKASAALD